MGVDGGYNATPGVWLHPNKPSLIIHQYTHGSLAGSYNPNDKFFRYLGWLSFR